MTELLIGAIAVALLVAVFTRFYKHKSCDQHCTECGLSCDWKKITEEEHV